MRLRTLLVIVCLAISTIPIGIIGGIQGFQSESIMLIGLIFLVTFFVSLTISYFIAKPIEKLTENIDKISKGKLDVDLEASEIKEINNLIVSLNRVMASLKLAIYKVGVKKGEIFEETIKPNSKKEKKVLEKRIGQPVKNVSYANQKTSEKEFDSIFLFNEKEKIIDCNDNLLNNLGYSKNEILKFKISDFDALEDKKTIKEKISKAKKDGFYSFKTIHKKKDGSGLLVTEKLIYDKENKNFKAIVKID